MPYKPNPPGPCPALAGFSLLAVSGRDAPAFLQAQTMNDVAALVAGQWHWNGWLTAKGRVHALFALLRLDDAAFRLVLPDAPATGLADALRRFVFRSKVELVAEESVVAAAGPAHPQVAGDRCLIGDDGAAALDFGGYGAARTLWLLPATHPALVPAEATVDAAWLAADIAHGLPRLGPAQREAWTPQMLSLERLNAFSLRKGCYPGQEIVARTHYLGQARRGLVRLSGSDLREGAGVDADGRTVGTVTCVDVSGDEALAVLSADAGDVLASGGQPVQRLPLLGGLARP